MAHPGGAPFDDQAPLVTGDAVVLDLRPAGFATRMAGLLIDVAVQVVALVLAVLLTSLVGSGLDAAATAAINLALIVLVVVGYPTAFETLTRGRSLGKLALGLRVVGTDGSPERFRQALGRALAAVVEIWTFSGVVALLCSLLNRDGRRVGDFIAGTMVVHERAARRPDDSFAMPPQLAEWARGAELSQLSSETAGMARQYLMRFGELTEESRYSMGVRIADLVSAVVSPPPPPGTAPPEYLAAVLAERRRREEERLAERRAGVQDAWQQGGAGPAAHGHGGTPAPGWPDGPQSPQSGGFPAPGGAPGGADSRQHPPS
ncbi:RDD family protein [Streptomonospora litoralis]|uniref:RDD family protein n=1 Tax=Streptomonospora litoralis TaxID=2498135 RepID=A0A4P6Q0N8_9ACTN|nr:RDD family protein [Streptomonospora litoralis]QBI52741.1 RDD family protein [Streptomonospora litoralis]